MKKHSRNRLRMLVLLAMAALGITALGAPAANAEIVSAEWGQSTSSLRLQGTLELEDAWENTTTCNSDTGTQTASATPGGSSFNAYNKKNNYYGFFSLRVLTFTCSNGTLELPLAPYGLSWPGTANYDTTTGQYFLSNSGFWTADQIFTNGFGGSYPKYRSVEQGGLAIEFRNPHTEIVEVENEYEEMEEVEVEIPDSQLVFDKTVIGEYFFGQIRATGTLTVDDGSGNPRTLSH